MSYKDLEAEMVQLAVKRGYPGDPTQLIFASASAWLDEQNRALLAKLPEAERARLLAKFPHLRGS